VLPLAGREVTVPIYDCAVVFDRGPVAPGASVAARLYPVSPEYWRAIPVGRVLGLYEPPRCVARARVVETLAT
jgi:hypothetical protein